MKKIIAIVFTVLMMFVTLTAFAAGSISVEDLYQWTPRYTWTEMLPAPTMENIEFAKDKLTALLGEEYELVDAFNIDIAYVYDVVKYKTPYFELEGNFVLILMNSEDTYYLVPIVNEDTATFDFTDVKAGMYAGYVVYSKK